MRVKLINEKDFANAVIDEGFIVQVRSLSLGTIRIYPAHVAEMASLLTKKVIILMEYIDFTYVFSKKSAKMLPERKAIN